MVRHGFRNFPQYGSSIPQPLKAMGLSSVVWGFRGGLRGVPEASGAVRGTI